MLGGVATLQKATCRRVAFALFGFAAVTLGFRPLGAGVPNHSGFGDALGQSSRAYEHGQLLRKTSMQHGVEGST